MHAPPRAVPVERGLAGGSRRAPRARVSRLRREAACRSGALAAPAAAASAQRRVCAEYVQQRQADLTEDAVLGPTGAAVSALAPDDLVLAQVLVLGWALPQTLRAHSLLVAPEEPAPARRLACLHAAGYARGAHRGARSPLAVTYDLSVQAACCAVGGCTTFCKSVRARAAAQRVYRASRGRARPAVPAQRRLARAREEASGCARQGAMYPCPPHTR